MTTSAERWKTLNELDEWLDVPMAVLSVAWLLLLVGELVWGEHELLSTFGILIWIIFIAEFALRFVLAPGKMRFLKRNWLTVMALVLPALRVFRALRVARVASSLRSVRLVRIVGTANRSMKALRDTLRRRGFGYVAGLTIAITFLGAAGMMNFEPVSEVEGGFTSYGHALWWTAMLVSSIGSDFWPATAEGRILSLLLSIYGLAVFGYITASFASFFIGRDTEEPSGPIASHAQIALLTSEIRGLRSEMQGVAAPG